MKTNLLFLMVIGSLLSFQSCVNDVIDNTFYCEEEGIFFGNALFSETSNSFWSYQPNQKLIFKDVNGNELELMQEDYDSTVQPMILQTVCGGPQLPAHEFHSVNAENKYVVFQDEARTVSIYMALSITPWYEIEDELSYFETVNISSNFTYFYFATDKVGSIDTPNYMWLGNYEQVDTTLLGKTFQDVYYNPNFNYSGFYSKSQGLVAFYDNDTNLYVLDRIE
jgi:hypothetical protein